MQPCRNAQTFEDRRTCSPSCSMICAAEMDNDMNKDMSPVEAVGHDPEAGSGDSRNDRERARLTDTVSPSEARGPTSDDPEPGGHTTSMLEQTLDRTLEMIRAVDVKTALYMGIATGMAAALPALVQAWDKATIRTWIILVLGALGPALCSIVCGIVTFPQTDAARPSLLFFGTIARLKPREYCERAVAS